MRLCIIPARGGSKRIRRKNIRPFCGQPILAYPIATARASDLFDQVIVSTDDADIAEVARAHGAAVPFMRPPELADDHCGTLPVIAHAIRWFQGQGELIDEVCVLYATAVFVTPAHLRAAYAQLTASRYEYVFSIVRYPHPIERALRLTGDGQVTPLCPEYRNTRTQDLEPFYHDAGQFYWGRARAFLAGLPLHSPGAAGYVLPSYAVQDIDTEDDWLRAERLYQSWPAGHQP